MSLRDLVIPDPGKILLQVDQSGADARVVSWLTRTGNYRKLFAYGIKPHTYTALRIFQEKFDKESPGITAAEALALPIEKLYLTEGWKELNNFVKKSETEYFIGKKVEHSGNYGEQVNTFITDVLNESDGKVALSKEQGQRFLDMRAELFPEIKHEFQYYVKHELETKNRTLRNLFGFPITFIGVWDDSLFRKSFAWIPQSTVAIITALAFTELQERLLACDSLLSGLDVLQDGHDSILTQCPIGSETVMSNEIKKHMNRELKNPFGETFRMESEASVGTNWRDMKEI
jgi:DNA polymerase I-like protein with 3'-5' exonuclease and polymerase domains